MCVVLSHLLASSNAVSTRETDDMVDCVVLSSLLSARFSGHAITR